LAKQFVILQKGGNKMAEDRKQQILNHISSIDLSIYTATYKEALKTYLGNIEWLKGVRANWLNSL